VQNPATAHPHPRSVYLLSRQILSVDCRSLSVARQSPPAGCAVSHALLQTLKSGAWTEGRERRGRRERRECATEERREQRTNGAMPFPPPPALPPLAAAEAGEAGEAL
jgi:hypothetical protein